MCEIENISFKEDTVLINNKVKQEVAYHLWIFCGYEDSEYNVVSTDAKFIKLINDLYKVFFDSSFIKGICNCKIIEENNWDYISDIKRKLYDINILRTAISHTVSKENCKYHISIQFKEWINSKCGTYNPTKDIEFKKLISELLSLKKELFELLDRLLTDLSSLSPVNKSKLIENWEEMTVEFYLKGINRDMFIGKLIEWYKINEKIDLNKKIHIPRYKINEFVMNCICLKEQKKISCYEQLKVKNFDKLTKEKKDRFDDLIRELNSNIDKIKKDVADFVNKNIADLEAIHYMMYYLSDGVLRKKIEVAVSEIKKNGLTLIPQDLIGYMINEDLKINF
ncbi:hypothetical protein J4O15_14155 [Lachnoanaerobaculum sp. Marseille-Q4761]|uniref:hypothetical protein n=1 Tax=Lachnoanaerobaculum sp. Marseille-Q4761 TaxID=2819511 RepID=UPI001AA143A5|nr:hypothetical protein [Lachnoanaerobaculum sp. Marseille-Q4761]MBO1872037.1 hypothetical protein [Lachnoanaerobaculum sp. Marseille-Q4761]